MIVDQHGRHDFEMMPIRRGFAGQCFQIQNLQRQAMSRADIGPDLLRALTGTAPGRYQQLHMH